MFGFWCLVFGIANEMDNPYRLAIIVAARVEQRMSHMHLHIKILRRMKDICQSGIIQNVLPIIPVHA